MGSRQGHLHSLHWRRDSDGLPPAATSVAALHYVVVWWDGAVVRSGWPGKAWRCVGRAPTKFHLITALRRPAPPCASPISCHVTIHQPGSTRSRPLTVTLQWQGFGVLAVAGRGCGGAGRSEVGWGV